VLLHVGYDKERLQLFGDNISVAEGCGVIANEGGLGNFIGGKSLLRKKCTISLPKRSDEKRGTVKREGRDKCSRHPTSMV